MPKPNAECRMPGRKLQPSDEGTYRIRDARRSLCRRDANKTRQVANTNSKVGPAVACKRGAEE